MREVLRRARTATLSAATVLALSTAGLAASSLPAAAAGCSGFTCHGLDPTAQGCTATATAQKSGTEAIVMNRYSSGCNANWARAALTQKGYDAGDSMVIIVTTTDSKGHLESMCYPGPNGAGTLNEYCYYHDYASTSWAYTDMVDGTNNATASAYVYDSLGKLIETDSATQ